MKKIVLGLAAATTLLLGCKEDHNLVTLHDSFSVDTTYVLPSGSIPSPDPHNVLIEDFTGVTCSNCPSAHDDILVPLESGHPGRINIMEMFVTDFPQTSPNPGETYDGFRDTAATQIEQGVYSSLFLMPIAGIDRMPIGSYGLNNCQIAKTDWNLDATNQLALVDSINLMVTSTFDSVSRTATILAKVTYLQTTFSPQNLSIAVVEDSLIDLQEFPSTVALYHYNGVFRGLVTSAPFGDPILVAVSPKEAGRVVQKVYSYHVNATLNAKHCRVIAFVHGNAIAAGQHVYQSWQAPLAP
jgi:Outer membrane protein Omp28